MCSTRASKRQRASEQSEKQASTSQNDPQKAWLTTCIFMPSTALHCTAKKKPRNPHTSQERKQIPKVHPKGSHTYEYKGLKLEARRTVPCVPAKLVHPDRPRCLLTFRSRVIKKGNAWPTCLLICIRIVYDGYTERNDPGGRMSSFLERYHARARTIRCYKYCK
jgi:hypothetical protein